MTCWHCDDVHRCNCIHCGHDTMAGRIAGDCIACKGRAVWDKIRTMVPDPRDFRHWKFTAVLGTHKRKFIPLDQLKVKD